MTFPIEFEFAEGLTIRVEFDEAQLFERQKIASQNEDGDRLVIPGAHAATFLAGMESVQHAALKLHQEIALALVGMKGKMVAYVGNKVLNGGGDDRSGWEPIPILRDPDRKPLPKPPILIPPVIDPGTGRRGGESMENIVLRPRGVPAQGA